MHGESALDAIQEYYDNVPSTDANASNRRGTRLLFYLQTSVNGIWLNRHWGFTQTSDSITASDGTTQTALPSDFGAFHPEGGIFLTSTGEPLTEEHFHRLTLDRLDPSAQSLALDRRFAVAGMSSAGLKLIEHMEADGDTGLTVFYQKTPPTITDADTSSGLEQIPAQWHETVVIPGAVYHLMLDIAKQNAKTWKAMYDLGLATMAQHERSKITKLHQMPYTASGGC